MTMTKYQFRVKQVYYLHTHDMLIFYLQSPSLLIIILQKGQPSRIKKTQQMHMAIQKYSM